MVLGHLSPATALRTKSKHNRRFRGLDNVASSHHKPEEAYHDEDSDEAESDTGVVFFCTGTTYHSPLTVCVVEYERGVLTTFRTMFHDVKFFNEREFPSP
jgi:hypothetical protein